MAISLQEQLLKAGLASKKQANKAKADKRKNKGKNKPAEDPEKVQRQQAEKREKDKQLNLQREQAKTLTANLSQARQIIESNRISIPTKADINHQFSHLKFVKSIYIDKPIQAQMFRGQLTIIFMDEKYGLIPTDQAHRVYALQPDWVVELPKQEKLDEDDPYADYEVPDDLMW